MLLQIDTQDQKEVTVFLKKNGQIIGQLTEKNQYGSQVLLPLIIKLLENTGCSFQALKGIQVATGPGSFIGLRVGVSVANALGFALKIPVNGKKMVTDLKY